MAKKKWSRDQKRKQKLQKRSEQQGETSRTSPAEHFFQDTERAIYETFVSAEETMLDRDVRQALKQLTLDVQRANLAAENNGAESPSASERLVRKVRQYWVEKHSLNQLSRLAAAQTLQGLAQKVDGIMAPGESQSYLRFLQASMEGPNAGRETPSKPSDADAVAEAQPSVGHVETPLAPTTRASDWSPDEARLRHLGLNWLRASNEATWSEFQSEAARMTESGQARAVANVCQYLYGLVQADPVEQALRPVLDAAHHQLAEVVTSEGE